MQESKNGLYICMNTFLGFGKQYVERNFNTIGQRVYLHLWRTQQLKEEDSSAGTGDPLHKKPTLVATGVEDGFDLTKEKFEYDEDVKIVILPDYLAFAWMADSASCKQEVQAWDGEVPHMFKHAFNLKQLYNPDWIPQCGCKCSKCDMRENLWLNLTDGSILCGRWYFDGSGGNDHAVEHYTETGYPLAVKLDTITPDGADLYSYDENDILMNTSLAESLSHLGIDILKMQKTDKTKAELDIDMNQHIDELLEYEEKKHHAEEEKVPLPELVWAQVPFISCLEAYGGPEQVEDFWSTSLQAKSAAIKTTRFASFPDYLVIQIKKFTIGFEWVPKKLYVYIEMPEELDISQFRGTGLQPGERNCLTLPHLWDKALKVLQAVNNSSEQAVDWIFSHIVDLDTEAAMSISERRSAVDSISKSVPVGPKVRHGRGKYQRFAFISHMGTSTMCSHYVCLIKKEGRWVIYTVQKVSASGKPTKDLGYI
ncbi:ubiquitin carboxyl-terminal hydrolase 5 isoform 2 [Cricetulus griseus]|nr:ubiquitin carboxyl-terminal hydrolase 5 isoform 2 [Cricetulus griseus]